MVPHHVFYQLALLAIIWFCQLVGSDLVTGQQKAHLGLDVHQSEP
jgi:hypothetical protein